MALDARTLDLPRALDARSLDVLFRDARTHNGWLEQPVSDDTLRALYDAAKWGPTAFNASPMRLIFVKSEEAKQRLLPALAPANAQKTMAAPVTAIVAHDVRFHDHLPTLFPAFDARSLYVDNAPLSEETAFRNGTLQAGYVILAARALGLDAGPMSGFDNAAVDREFFPGGKVKSNILINFGYGDRDALRPRGPRLPFETAATIL